jgi:hypothetical protein
MAEKQTELFDNEKEMVLDWSFLEPYRKPLTRLFYRIFFYKSWKPEWYFGKTMSVCDALLGHGDGLKNFMSRVMDGEMSYIFKRPMINIFIFDDWLHEEFGNYEDTGLSMEDLIEQKFDLETMKSLQALL